MMGGDGQGRRARDAHTPEIIQRYIACCVQHGGGNVIALSPTIMDSWR